MTANDTNNRAMRTAYRLTQEKLLSIKKQLDSYVMWREKGGMIEVRQVIPNKHIAEMLKRITNE